MPLLTDVVQQLFFSNIGNEWLCMHQYQAVLFLFFVVFVWQSL